MLEKDIERKAVAAAKQLGWLSYKFSSPARRGVPDRIFLRNGTCVFVEFKRPGVKPTALQEHEMSILRRAGFIAEVASSVSETLTVLAASEKMPGKTGG